MQHVAVSIGSVLGGNVSFFFSLQLYQSSTKRGCTHKTGKAFLSLFSELQGPQNRFKSQAVHTG